MPVAVSPAAGIGASRPFRGAEPALPRRQPERVVVAVRLPGPPRGDLGQRLALGIPHRRTPVQGADAAQLTNLVSFAALAVGLVWLTVVGVRRNLPPVAIAAAGVAIFVLANKVYSPTYDVWLLVFFVLVPFSRRLFLAFCAVDLVVYVAVYGSFHGLVSQGTVETVLPFLVIVRTFVLVQTVFVATRGRRSDDRRPVERAPGPEPRPVGVLTTNGFRPARPPAVPMHRTGHREMPARTPRRRVPGPAPRG
jgi:hypothetical protein